MASKHPNPADLTRRNLHKTRADIATLRAQLKTLQQRVKRLEARKPQAVIARRRVIKPFAGGLPVNYYSFSAGAK